MVKNMNKLKKLTVSILTAVMISITLPVSTPVYSNTVLSEAATTSVKLNVNTASVYIGKTLQLKLSGTNQNIKWSTSNKSIAKVTTKGTVTGLNKGTVKITAMVGTKKYISTITVKKKVLTAEEVYQKALKSTVEIVAATADGNYNLGSGFFIDNGIIVTNYHVVGETYDMEVQTYDGTIYDVQQVLGYDKDIDIAILKVNSNNESLVNNQEGITVGQSIYILGSPLGLTGTFASGMVSSASRVADGVDYIQVTAPMSPGNSGGPLLNKYGEVMGINSWQYADGQNLNFSINISEVDKIKTDSPETVAQFYNETLGTSAADSGNINLRITQNESGTYYMVPTSLSLLNQGYYLLKAGIKSKY
jgi:serine protease Do